MLRAGLSTRRRVTLAFLYASSLVLLVVAIVFNHIIDGVIDLEMKDNLPIKNGSTAYKFWQRPPVPVSFNIYVFDVTNPEEVLAGTEVPAVIEKGPYVYTMHIEKTDIKWHPNNTVEYVQPQTFVFNREASVGPDTDTFTTINIPFITTATVLQYEYPWLQELVDALFKSKGEEAFMRRSVYDIWWGYYDPVLEEAAETMKKFNITSELLNGKFGFYTDKNNTGDGLYNVYSGMNGNLDNYVTIDRWNGCKNLSIWNSDYANGIRGTDGSMQPPFVDSSKNLSIFDAYLHRSLKLVYNSTSSYRGIRTLRYYVPYSEFANATDNPDNAGFCTPDVNHCIPSGAYNLSVASYYAPMYVSMPHFIGGDPYYRQQVEGLHPDQSKHQPLYDIHALTGVSLRAARRYQIVVRTQSFPHFTKFSNFGVRYIPVLWIDGMAETDADTASMLKHTIQDPLDMIPYFRIATFAFSGVLVVIATVLLVYWRKKSREHLYTKLESTEREPLSRNSKIQDGTTDEPASFRKDSYGATPGQILNYNGTAGQASNNFGSTFNRRSEDEGDTSSDHRDSFIDESLYFDPQSPERTRDNSFESV